MNRATSARFGSSRNLARGAATPARAKSVVVAAMAPIVRTWRRRNGSQKTDNDAMKALQRGFA
jgi:hypothetical protein